MKVTGKLKLLAVGVGISALLVGCSESTPTSSSDSSKDIKEEQPIKGTGQMTDSVEIEDSGQMTESVESVKDKEAVDGSLTVVEKGVELSLSTDRLLTEGILEATVTYVGEEESITLINGGRMVSFQINGIDNEFKMISPMTMAYFQTPVEKGKPEVVTFEVGPEALAELKKAGKYEVIAEPAYSVENVEPFTQKVTTVVETIQ